MQTQKVIVTIAPTGGMASKKQNPNLPTQPQEIADDVYRCFNAGASLVAVHARRKDDLATCEPAIYREINGLIRAKRDIIINNSTGGGINGDMVRQAPNGYPEIIWEERLKGMEAGAEMCTLDPTTIICNFEDRSSRNRCGCTRASLEDVFDRFPRLKERSKQAAGTLSGGERQMLALGRALMAKPKLLVLDEPSLGLAPLIVREIFRTIASLRGLGVSVLLVEQNARAALETADFGYVLETGEIVQSGPAETLIHDPKLIAAYLGGH